MTQRKPAAKTAAAKPKAASKAEPKVEPGTPIERANSSEWWCPLCDHASEARIVTCPRCGAERDGDTVKAA